MTYYVFKRKKVPATMTYGVVRVNDSSRLPEYDIHGGIRVNPGPWEYVESIEDGGPYPTWFALPLVDQDIDKIGYYLLDNQLAFKTIDAAEVDAAEVDAAEVDAAEVDAAEGLQMAALADNQADNSLTIEELIKRNIDSIARPKERSQGQS
jgi:hypothetical protein